MTNVGQPERGIQNRIIVLFARSLVTSFPI
jgi:hypothetical protein